MKNIKIDFATNTITVTKSFLEAAQTPYSEECITLHNLQTDFPNMRIVTRTTKCSHTDNPNKGLTYKYMRKFVSTMDKENISVFNDTIIYFEDKYESKSTVYKCVRNWFLENYPYHNELIVDNAPKRKPTVKSISGVEGVANGSSSDAA